MNYIELPEEVREELDSECGDAILNFVGEVLGSIGVQEPEVPALSPEAVLQALLKAVKAALKAETPKANPSTEDAVEKRIRRDRVVKEAITAACDAIEAGSDGSWQEYEYFLTEFVAAMHKKSVICAQQHLMKMDISGSLEKIAGA